MRCAEQYTTDSECGEGAVRPAERWRARTGDELKGTSGEEEAGVGLVLVCGVWFGFFLGVCSVY